MTGFDQLFNNLSTHKVAVIGDVMLDTYWWGNVERISPEAPVPIVSLHHKEQRIGGAGNVALNTTSFGAETFLFSVTGNDAEADILIQLLQQKNINADNLVRSHQRHTTNKIRIMGHNQQMLRLDVEVINDIDETLEQKLLQNFTSFLNQTKPAVVIFEDYNKGVLTKSVIEKIISLCRQHNIITTVDPKQKNFFAYEGVTIFKPNLKEVKEGLRISFDDVNEPFLNSLHEKLNNQMQHDISLITLSEKGIYFKAPESSGIVPSHIRNIADVSGAGDTVIAVASLIYAATKNITLAAEIANIAGGLVCEEVGTVAINKEKLLQECKELLK